MKQIHLRDRLLSGTNVLRQLMFLFMVVLCTSSAMAQKKVTGTIVDAFFGEPIIGARRDGEGNIEWCGDGLRW